MCSLRRSWVLVGGFALLSVVVSAIVVTALIGFAPQTAVAQSDPESSAELEVGTPRELEVGIYVASVFELDFAQSTFQTIFWLWWIDGASDRCDKVGVVEVINARDYEQLEDPQRVGLDDGRCYTIAKYSAVINQPWDTSEFPFDEQLLRITIEKLEDNSSDVVLVADAGNSVVGREVVLEGWSVNPLEIKPTEFRYRTNFGNPTEGTPVFSRIDFLVPIERKHKKLFIEVYIGFFLAFLICGVIAVIDLTDLGARLGMGLAAVFGAVGNKSVLENNYPSVARFGLPDVIEFATFALIILSLGLTVIAFKLDESDRKDLARTLNDRGFPALLIGYALTTAVFVVLAVRT